MSRPRSGTLIWKPSGWHARVWMPIKDGDGNPVLDDDGKPKERREFVDLETKDRGVAKRKLASLVAGIEAGRISVLEDAKAKASTAETFKEYAEAWIEPRKKSKVSWAAEAMWLKDYAYSTIGALPLPEVRRVHIKQILVAAANRGRARGSVSHIRRVLHRVFASALDDEIIIANPVAGVKLPAEARVDQRPRTLPTDEEMLRLFACTDPKVGLEIKLVALIARELGGARTCEVNRLDWLSVDRLHFTACVLPRGKGGAPQPLDLPDDVTANLRAWWESKGRPASGPVFPVEGGRRKGEWKGSSVSYATRLRRAFTLAGVTRDELHKDTPVSRRCDFHSLRRAYVTSLAAANVNEQRSMRLAGHTSSATHRRYLMDTPEMRKIPILALPAQGIRVLAPAGDQSPQSTPNHAERESYAATGTDDATHENSCVDSVSDSAFEAMNRGSNPCSRTEENAIDADRSGTAGDFSYGIPVRVARVAECAARWPEAAEALVAFAGTA